MIRGFSGSLCRPRLQLWVFNATLSSHFRVLLLVSSSVSVFLVKSPIGSSAVDGAGFFVILLCSCSRFASSVPCALLCLGFLPRRLPNSLSSEFTRVPSSTLRCLISPTPSCRPLLSHFSEPERIHFSRKLP
ncbi:hypothetical protein BJX65DRAFT_238489 [Aspergillus insuetus]